MADRTLKDDVDFARSKNYSDDQILGLLEGGSWGPTIQAAKAQGYAPDKIINTLLSVDGDRVAKETANKAGEGVLPTATGSMVPGFVSSGVASGAANTLGNLYEGVRKLPGLGGLPELPQGVRDLASGEQLSGPGKAARAVEQGAEYALPGAGVEAIAGKVAGGLGKAATRVLGGALGDAATTLAQTKDPQAAMASAVTSAAINGALQTVAGVMKAIPPSQAYGALKYPKEVSLEQQDEIMKNALDRGINISRSGAQKALDAKLAIGQNINATLAKNANTQISPKPIYRILDELKKIGKEDKSFLASVQRYEDEFTQAHGGRLAKTIVTPSKLVNQYGVQIPPTVRNIPSKPITMTVGQAQEAKKNLYQLVKRGFDQTVNGGGKKAAMTEISLGLKDALEKAIPELKDLNRDYANQKILMRAINEYLKNNHNLITTRNLMIGSILAAAPTAAGMPFSYTLVPAALYEVLANPRIRSAMVVMAHRGAPKVVDLGKTLSHLGAYGTGQAMGSLENVPEKP